MSELLEMSDFTIRNQALEHAIEFVLGEQLEVSANGTVKIAEAFYNFLIGAEVKEKEY